ncbi:MAG: CsiV family protein [Gammaproteobacteria bacterium]
MRVLPTLALLAASLVATLPRAALAERYRVDLILFADRSAEPGETPQPAVAPDTARTFEPWEVMPLRNAGIEVLEDELFGLMDVWKRLDNSASHEPLVRIAWIQADPPAERGVAIRLKQGTPMASVTAAGSSEIYPVDGWAALMAGRYLHLDTSFVQTDALEDGTLGSYRLRERRRLRRDELNHLDSPRLGIVVRVQKADATAVVVPKPKPAPRQPAPKQPAPKKPS